MATEPKYILKLTWKSLWIVLTGFITIIGSSFGVGVKVEAEIAKIERAKLEQEYIEKINQKELDLYSWKRQAKEHEENSVFFKNQYLTYKNRLETCLQDKTYVKSLEINEE
jgi:hypothetical protein